MPYLLLRRRNAKNFKLLKVRIVNVQPADIQLYQIFRPCPGVDFQYIVLTAYIYYFVSRLNTANYVFYCTLVQMDCVLQHK